MAELSNQLLPVAVLVYVAAMMCYLVEYAFGRRGAVARAATRTSTRRSVAGVGGAGRRPIRRRSSPAAPVSAGVAPAPAGRR